MRKIIALIVLVALWAVVSAYDCNANLSGDNNASPARSYRSSSSCNVNLSGDNNAAPARMFNNAVCSGKGGCVEGACVCNPGYQGENCEYDCTATTLAPATTDAPTTVAPTTAAPTVQATPRPTVACPPCPCGEENLSGDNNASPARKIRDGSNNSCPTCKACPTTVAPTVQLTSAPVTTAAPQTTGAPSVGLPYCDEVNLSGDNNASPARSAKTSSSCNVNLSGDNNASPARRFRNSFEAAVCSGKGGCVDGSCVCNVGYKGENCEIQYCIVRGSTMAPTVNLTPKPTTSTPATSTKAPTQNESGDDNSRQANSAAKIGAVAGLATAAIITMLL